MQLSKLLKFLCIMIVLSLIYINMQMNIIDFAYQEESYKQKVRNLIEENSDINYKILTLKSANNIGIKMLANNSQLHFGDLNNIKIISMPEVLGSKQHPIEELKDGSNKQSLLSLLSLRPRIRSGKRY